ncbi:hypothetical protein BLA50215_05622 [Burkholderia lata]|nr:hypothetical protein BLA50215_05622 [Burkholderia lata]
MSICSTVARTRSIPLHGSRFGKRWLAWADVDEAPRQALRFR